MKLLWSAIGMAMAKHNFDKPRLEVAKLIWGRHDVCPPIRSVYRQDIEAAVKRISLTEGRTWDDFSSDEKLLFASASHYLKALKQAVMDGDLILTHPFDTRPRTEGDGDWRMGWQFTLDDIVGDDDLITFGKRYGIDPAMLDKVIELLGKPDPAANTRMALFDRWCDRLQSRLEGSPWAMDRLPVHWTHVKEAIPPALHPNFDRLRKEQTRIRLAPGTGRSAPPADLLRILHSVKTSTD